MKKVLASFFVGFMFISSLVFAANKLIIVEPKDLQWHPANGLKDVEVAVISGNPEKKEPYIARLRFPANYQIPPHIHRVNEYSTVISGALYVGNGMKFDTDHVQEVAAGGFIVVPAKVPHYGFTKEETILQVNGVGPWGMIFKDKKKMTT